MPIENSVRTYRISHHDTQQDLAAAVGVNEKTIRNIEVTGKCSLEIALHLSEYFNITVNVNILKLLINLFSKLPD